MSLRLRFWGTRGSIASPGGATVRYGGNTPCLELRTSDGRLVILDAGTGIRALGQQLVAEAQGRPIVGELWLTHLHWDHVQGLPFFAPLFEAGSRFAIRGPGAVEEVVKGLFHPLVFPVPFDGLPASVDIAAVSAGVCDRQGFVVRALDVQHPGGALGYRITDGRDGPALVYVSDNELAPHGSYGSPAAWRDGLVELARGAAVLVHDATYTVDEYAHRGGWGHSTYADALALALDAGVERLVLFHHSPERTDEEIDMHVAACRAEVARRGARLEVLAAAEGLTLTV